MAKRIPALVIVAISVASLLVLGTGAALAKKVDVQVSGNPLNLVVPGGDVSLSNVSLDGTDQNTTGSLGTFRVVDPRGTGTGWYLTMASTDFEENTDPSKTIPSDSGGFAITNANLTTVSGNGGVTAGTGNLAPAALTVMDSPGPFGRGVNEVDPDVELQVPAETYIGTYSATVTATLISY
jgi:hypothetical protein